MLGDKKVDLVYLEVTFCNMYQAAPRFDEVCAFLADNKMTIVSFYDMHYRNNRLAWTDALFISTSCLSRIENIRGRSMD